MSCTLYRRLQVVFLLGLLLSPIQVRPEPFQDGMEAMRRGDYAEAFCHWQPLAVRGHRDAQYHLGWFSANGYGLRVDLEKATAWWRRAAEQGHEDAPYALGMAYLSGEGIGQSYLEAVQWLLKAARQGNEGAQDILRSLLRNNSDEIKAFLPQLSSESWIGKHLRAQGEKANARSGPDLDRSVLAELRRDVQVVEIGREGEWVQVLVADPPTVAWVYARLLEPVTAAVR